MNSSILKYRKSLAAIAVLCLLPLLNGFAADTNSSQSSSSHAAVTLTAPGVSVAIDDSAVKVATEDATPTQPPSSSWHPRHWHRHHHENAIVNIGHDTTLAVGERADTVVSILGSSTSAGEVADVVVSVMGNTRVTGPVGDSAVAVLGNTYVDSKVEGDVVAVLGDVELGPQADIGGEVVAVGGSVTRDPAAVVRGGVQNVSFGAHWPGFAWLRPWVEHCLLYGRLLAFAPGLGWAWTVALISLALSILSAVLFRNGVEKCVQTLAAHPGQSVLAALLTMVATPVLMVLLCITIIGILAIPFIGLALLTAESFGKLVMLAWLGQRITRSAKAGVTAHPAFAVFIGGVIVLALYAVPVVGLIVYKLLGFIGLGVVIYTLLLMMRARRETQRAASVNGATSSRPASATAHAQHAAQTDAAAAEAASESDMPHVEPARSSTAPAVAAVAYPRAGFWLRMGALLLDAILVGAILHFVFDSAKLHLVLLASYGALLWKLKGTTIGGIVFNLQVVRLDGREIDWATAVVRALSCFLSLFVAGLGFIWIAFDDEKQSWHDKIAGTVVVRVPKGVSLL